MLQYAREDTHYLLYIHDRLKRQLVEEKGTPGLEVRRRGISENIVPWSCSGYYEVIQGHTLLCFLYVEQFRSSSLYGKGRWLRRVSVFYFQTKVEVVGIWVWVFGILI